MRLLFFCFCWFLQGGKKDDLIPEIFAIVCGQKIHNEKQVSALAERKVVKVLANDPKAVLAKHFFLHVVVELIGELLP